MTQALRGKRRMIQPRSDIGDDGWEDVASSNNTVDVARSLSPAGSSRSNVAASKKRRALAGERTVFAAIQKRPQQRMNSPTIANPVELTTQLTRVPREPLFDWEEVQHTLLRTVVSSLKFIWDIGRMCIILLKWPIVIAIVFFLLAMIVVQISQAIRTTLSPFCIVPGLGFICSPDASQLPSPAPLTQGGIPVQSRPQRADYPGLMNVQGKAFETLLEESVDGPGLALEIKNAEMATSDLIMLVRVSDLKSKDRLAATLVQFVEDARKAGRSLTRFNARVGGAVDNVLAVNDYALHAIEAARSKPSGLSLWPFNKASTDVVTSSFNDAMHSFSINMERIVREAESSRQKLEALEETLETLHDMVARENSDLSGEKANILADLWTMVGGNKKELRTVDKHLNLLKNMGAYRTRALAHIVAASQALQAMDEDMRDLRDRVAAPEWIGDNIPVEVHIKAIQNGLERLEGNRLRARRTQEEIADRIVVGAERA